MRRFPPASIAVAIAVCVGSLAACTAAPPAGPVLPADWSPSMLAQLNALRAGSGLAPLADCPALDRSAQNQSNGQAAMRKLSHSGSDSSTLQQRVARAGYAGWSSLGENVGSGFVSVDGVMAAWMGDAEHRNNLLGAGYTSVGFGEASGSNGVSYWTQDFGSGGTC
jgi:uncharacterized protein YkwD